MYCDYLQVNLQGLSPSICNCNPLSSDRVNLLLTNSMETPKPIWQCLPHYLLSDFPSLARSFLLKVEKQTTKLFSLRRERICFSSPIWTEAFQFMVSTLNPQLRTPLLCCAMIEKRLKKNWKEKHMGSVVFSKPYSISHYICWGLFLATVF